MDKKSITTSPPYSILPPSPVGEGPGVRSGFRGRGFWKIFTILLVLATISYSIIQVQNRLTNIKDKSWFLENMSFLPSTDKLKPCLLGFSTTYANYLWIKTILYFGGHYTSDKDYPWLVSMVDIVTRLNPQFYPAYEFAGNMVPDLCKNNKAAIIILNRGINAMGNKRWNLYFMLGMVYFTYYNNQIKAAECFSIAAHIPSNHTAKLTSLAATFYSQAGAYNQALQFLNLMYETAEDPAVKKQAYNKLVELSKKQR